MVNSTENFETVDKLINKDESSSLKSIKEELNKQEKRELQELEKDANDVDLKLISFWNKDYKITKDVDVLLNKLGEINEDIVNNKIRIEEKYNASFDDISGAINYWNLNENSEIWKIYKKLSDQYVLAISILMKLQWELINVLPWASENKEAEEKSIFEKTNIDQLANDLWLVVPETSTFNNNFDIKIIYPEEYNSEQGRNVKIPPQWVKNTTEGFPDFSSDYINFDNKWSKEQYLNYFDNKQEPYEFKDKTDLKIFTNGELKQFTSNLDKRTISGYVSQFFVNFCEENKFDNLYVKDNLVLWTWENSLKVEVVRIDVVKALIIREFMYKNSIVSELKEKWIALSSDETKEIYAQYDWVIKLDSWYSVKLPSDKDGMLKWFEEYKNNSFEVNLLWASKEADYISNQVKIGERN